MPEGTMNWVQPVATALGGGLMGALLTLFVSARRQRIQPILGRITFQPLFSHAPSVGSMKARITLSAGAKDHQFENLHLETLEIVNIGNRDFESFAFGVTLQAGEQAVNAEWDSGDRHHQVSLSEPLSPESPKSQIDVTLTPLNRGDAYTLRLYTVIQTGSRETRTPILSTRESIRFVDAPSSIAVFTRLLLRSVLVPPGVTVTVSNEWLDFMMGKRRTKTRPSGD